MRFRLTAFSLLFAAVTAFAVEVRIDFGDAAGGVYNTIARSGRSQAGETDIEGVRFPLTVFGTGGDSGISVVLEDVPGRIDYTGPADWGDNKATGNYDGPYPDIFSGVDPEALADGFFLKNRSGANSVTMTFEGLSVSEEYHLLFYGARGGTIDSASTFSLITGTPLGVPSGSIAHNLTNATDVVSLTAISTEKGELAFQWISSGAYNSSAALNYLELTSRGGAETLGMIAY